MKQQVIAQRFFIVAAVATLLGAVLHLFNTPVSFYIFAFGAVLFVVSHFFDALFVKEDDFRLRRLARIGFIFSLFLLVSAYLMFKGSNSWVVFLLIYAIVAFYLSFRT